METNLEKLFLIVITKKYIIILIFPSILLIFVKKLKNIINALNCWKIDNLRN